VYICHNIVLILVLGFYKAGAGGRGVDTI